MGADNDHRIEGLWGGNSDKVNAARVARKQSLDIFFIYVLYCFFEKLARGSGTGGGHPTREESLLLVDTRSDIMHRNVETVTILNSSDEKRVPKWLQVSSNQQYTFATRGASK